MRVVTAIDCLKRFERTHVAFGESAPCASMEAKKPRSDFTAHTKRLAIRQCSQRMVRTDDKTVVATAGNDLDAHIWRFGTLRFNDE